MSTAASYERQPGSTQGPLYKVHIDDQAVDTTDWTATYQLRKRDKDTTPALALEGEITRLLFTDLDARVQAAWLKLLADEAKRDHIDPADPPEHVWQIVVTNTTADTQDLRGDYQFGCELHGPGYPDTDNIPAGVGTITFGPDPAR